MPGQRSVASAVDREFVEEQWRVPPGTIRDEVGPGHQEFEGPPAGHQGLLDHLHESRCHRGKRSRVIAGLEGRKLVVTQDAYEATATNRYADIVLPATLWAESDAVMVNSERTTLLQASIRPPGKHDRTGRSARSRMGFGEHFDFSSSEQVFDEIRRFSNPVTADLRRASIAASGVPTVAVSARRRPGLPDPYPTTASARTCSSTPTDNDWLAFHPARRAVFHARPHMDPTSARRRLPVAHPLQHQWHTMTKTGRWPGSQARQRAVRRDPSIRCGGDRHRRRPIRRAHVAPRPPCCHPW